MKKLLLIPFCAFFTLCPMMPDEFIDMVNGTTKMINKAVGPTTKDVAFIAAAGAAGAGAYFLSNFWQSQAGIMLWDNIKPDVLLPKLFHKTWAAGSRILNPQPLSENAKQAIQVAEIYATGAAVAVGIQTVKNIREQNRATEALKKEQEEDARRLRRLQIEEDDREEIEIRNQIQRDKIIIRNRYMNDVRKSFPLPATNVI